MSNKTILLGSYILQSNVDSFLLKVSGTNFLCFCVGGWITKKIIWMWVNKFFYKQRSSAVLCSFSFTANTHVFPMISVGKIFNYCSNSKPMNDQFQSLENSIPLKGVQLGNVKVSKHCISLLILMRRWEWSCISIRYFA